MKMTLLASDTPKNLQRASEDGDDRTSAWATGSPPPATRRRSRVPADLLGADLDCEPMVLRHQWTHDSSLERRVRMLRKARGP